jgi:hypothetical protein
MRRFLIAAALTCVLAVTTLAGDVPTVGAPAPPPTGLTQTHSTVAGEIPSVGKAGRFSGEALSALLSVLSFLAA